MRTSIPHRLNLLIGLLLTLSLLVGSGLSALAGTGACSGCSGDLFPSSTSVFAPCCPEADGEVRPVEVLRTAKHKTKAPRSIPSPHGRGPVFDRNIFQVLPRSAPSAQLPPHPALLALRTVVLRN